MTQLQQIFAATAFAALGVWLMVPPRGVWRRGVGSVLAAVGVGLWLAQLPGVGDGFAAAIYWIMAGVAVLGGVGTISSQNPVYSALWFAVSLMGTAALFLLHGAQFLAMATLVVYAGAIVVTFLFVLMLAQPDGTAFYDRLGTGRTTSLLSAICGATLVSLLTAALAGMAKNGMIGPDKKQLAQEVLHDQHVARLGGELFARNLLAVELAGVLLLVALVGASAMMLRSRGPDEAPDASAGGDHD